MKKGLILEGGALRGIYTAGVLDAFLDNNINFDGVVGVSAGAIHGASFLSKQKGRSLKSTADWCWSPKYMGWGSLFFTGNYFNSKFCYEKIPNELYPFDHKTFNDNPSDFYVVCTDARTGEPVYHLCPDLEYKNLKYLQASASMPVVSRPLKLDGKKWLDGGIADSVPIKKFQEMGYEKNVVILTQEKKPASSEFNVFVPLTKIFCPFRKSIIKELETQFDRYEKDLSYLEEQQQDGKVFIIRPKSKPVADVMERNPENIRKTHQQGYEDGLSCIEALKIFFAE